MIGTLVNVMVYNFRICPLSDLPGTNLKCYFISQPSIKAINALVKALLDLDMVAIVRKVYRKNCAPQIGVFIPTCEEESYVSKLSYVVK